MESLTERPVVFHRDYRVRCEHCEAVTIVTRAQWLEQLDGCHVACTGCRGDIHFGPAVLAIADAEDAALDDELAPSLAWYHSSKEPNWPPAQAPSELWDCASGVFTPSAAWVADRKSLALHVGTYAAAVENMTRRICDQRDEDAQFHLHRVALRPEVSFEPGYRDENAHAAAQLTQNELKPFGAIRYLNVYEDLGGISLAVAPGAIAAVQSIEFPLAVDFRGHERTLTAAAVLRSRIAEEHAKGVGSLDRLDAARSRAHSGIAGPYTPAAVWMLLAEIDQLIAAAVTDGQPAPACAAVSETLTRWRHAHPYAGDEQLVAFAAALTGAIADPGRTITALAAEPARALKT